MKVSSMRSVALLAAAMVMWAFVGAAEREATEDPQLAQLHIQLRGVSQ